MSEIQKENLYGLVALFNNIDTTSGRKKEPTYNVDDWEWNQIMLLIRLMEARHTSGIRTPVVHKWIPKGEWR